MINKQSARLRASKRSRFTIRRLGVCCLRVHRTSRHIYVQLISKAGNSVLASASSLDREIRGTSGYTGNIETAKCVGALIAKRALLLGISKVAFDRSGFKYHGRVKALADAAREAGLAF